ncbi:MAG TPA: PQQ-dependent sugar dehydrogenase [Thermoanaerobaculia bacterium]|nr:PQQ-dependent sugar dehydrogenase [Thermoanaerobaculia bacterium]
MRPERFPDVVRAPLLAAALPLLVAQAAPAQAPPSAGSGDRVDYASEIRPLLASYCYECHGPERATREANLRLDEKRFAFRDLGGYHAIVPGRPEESELYLRIASEFAEDRMPPYTAGVQLSDEQTGLIRRWIAQGAEWPEAADTAEDAAGDATSRAAARRRSPGLPPVELPEAPFVIHTHDIAEVRVSILARGLSHPWSLAFLPRGDMLITERAGSLRLVRDGVLVAEPIEGVPADVLARGLSGLMEVAVHPEFDQNRLVYLTYTRKLGERTGTVALVRGRLDGMSLRDVEDVFVAEPWLGDDGVPADNPNVQLASTAAARLLFAPDGRLFMTMGGAFGVEREDGTSSFLGKAMLAQDPSSHAGKLLRLEDDGSPPADNPFVGRQGYRPEIYSLGHRNQQGLALHPETGQPFATEHGVQGGDELNAIEAGGNYGWPVVSYGRHYDGPRIAKQLWQEGMKEPLVFWVPSIAPSGLTFYTGDRFPEWRGNLFVGALMEGRIPRTGHLERIVFNERGEELRRESMLRELRQRIRDVRQGPDGLLYVLTEENDGALLRLEPAPGSVGSR